MTSAQVVRLVFEVRQMELDGISFKSLSATMGSCPMQLRKIKVQSTISGSKVKTCLMQECTMFEQFECLQCTMFEWNLM